MAELMTREQIDYLLDEHADALEGYGPHSVADVRLSILAAYGAALDEVDDWKRAAAKWAAEAGRLRVALNAAEDPSP